MQALPQMGLAHTVDPTTPVTADDARHVARVMSALATPSRVRILGRLREGPCTVGELALAIAMEQPAVSHQLRILRDLGLVLGNRAGRHVIYGLYDSHVAMLLDEALRHIEHLRVGDPTIPHRGASMTEHTHDAPHVHEHEHDGEAHVHAHTGHDHEHVEHAHEHEHDGEAHAHAHVHEEGVEDVHEHEHA
jgi:DNA-binding transcriptional ArsR family regulator